MSNELFDIFGRRSNKMKCLNPQNYFSSSFQDVYMQCMYLYCKNILKLK